MRNYTGLTLLSAAVLLSGCAALTSPSTPQIKGVIAEADGQSGYEKTFPHPPNTVLNTQRIGQCLSSEGLTPQGNVYVGNSRYLVERLGESNTFNVSYQLQVTNDAPLTRYHFRDIRQAPVEGSVPASSQWLTANPQPLVDALAAVAGRVNRCITQ